MRWNNLGSERRHAVKKPIANTQTPSCPSAVSAIGQRVVVDHVDTQIIVAPLT